MSKEQVEEKRQIKKEVQSRINKGEPKQQILEELSQQYKDKITIVKQLESTPSKVMKYKYRVYNYALILLLLGTLVLDTIMLLRVKWENPLLDGFACLNVLLDAVLMIGVIRYRIENYSWISSRALVLLIQMIVTHVYYHQAIDTLTFVILVLVIASFVLGLFLGVRLCPQRVPKVIEVDIDENERINKTVYVFPD